MSQRGLKYWCREFMKNKCYSCGGVLPSFGEWRNNGANHPDWKHRYFHKLCYYKNYGVDIGEEKKYEMG